MPFDKTKWNERNGMSPYKVCIQNIDYIVLKDSLKGSIPDSCADFFIYSEMRVFDVDFLEKGI